MCQGRTASGLRVTLSVSFLIAFTISGTNRSSDQSPPPTHFLLLQSQSPFDVPEALWIEKKYNKKLLPAPHPIYLRYKDLFHLTSQIPCKGNTIHYSDNSPVVITTMAHLD